LISPGWQLDVLDSKANSVAETTLENFECLVLNDSIQISVNFQDSHLATSSQIINQIPVLVANYTALNNVKMLQRWHSWEHLKRQRIMEYTSSWDNSRRIIPINLYFLSILLFVNYVFLHYCKISYQNVISKQLFLSLEQLKGCVE